jgi:shikimate dehydrogenase
MDKDKLRELVDNVLIGQFSNYNIEIKAANSIDGLKIADCDLLVNATPIGMKEDDPCLVDERFIHKDLLVYDLIYNPAQTKLLKMAEKRKARVSNGLGMLLYQGAEAFEIWTGREAPVEVMRNALNQAIKR